MMLEPSAGNGNIVNFFWEKRKDIEMRCCEIDPINKKNLNELIKGIGYNPKEVIYNEGNFLRLETSDRMDYVIMNPPFNLKADENEYKVKVLDLDFVKKAYSLLRKGGVLVAIVYQKHLKKTIADKRGNELKEWIFKHKDTITNKIVKFKAEKDIEGSVSAVPISFVKIIKKNYDEDEEIQKEIFNLLQPQPKEIPEYANLPQLVEIKGDTDDKDINFYNANEETEKIFNQLEQEELDEVNKNLTHRPRGKHPATLIKEKYKDKGKTKTYKEFVREYANKNNKNLKDSMKEIKSKDLWNKFKMEGGNLEDLEGGAYNSESEYEDNEADEDYFNDKFIKETEGGDCLEYKDECVRISLCKNGNNNLELDHFYKNDNQEEYCNQFKKYGIRKLLHFLNYLKKEGELGGINNDTIISLNPSTFVKRGGDINGLKNYYKSLGFKHRGNKNDGYMDINVKELIDNLSNIINNLEGGNLPYKLIHKVLDDGTILKYPEEIKNEIGGSEYHREQNNKQPKFNGELNLSHNSENIDEMLFNKIIQNTENILISGCKMNNFVNNTIIRHNTLHPNLSLDITIYEDCEGTNYPYNISHNEYKDITIHICDENINDLTKKLNKFNNIDSILAIIKQPKYIINYLSILNDSRAKGEKYLYFKCENLHLEKSFKVLDLLKNIESSDAQLKIIGVNNEDEIFKILGFEEGKSLGNNLFYISLTNQEYPDDKIEKIIYEYNKINNKELSLENLRGYGFFGNIKKYAHKTFSKIRNKAFDIKDLIQNNKQEITDKTFSLLMKSNRMVYDLMGNNFELNIDNEDDINYYITQETYKDKRDGMIGGYILDNEIQTQNFCAYINTQNSHIIIGYRGSAIIQDFITDISLARGNLKDDEDFNDRLKLTRQIKDKYGLIQYSLVGHSLGGKIAIDIGQMYPNDYVCGFNSGQGWGDIRPKEHINGKTYSFYGDIVSVLTLMKYKNVVIIKKPNETTYDPLEAHTLDNFRPSRTLDELTNDNIKGGNLYKKIFKGIDNEIREEEPIKKAVMPYLKTI
jgi:hypothetical protein